MLSAPLGVQNLTRVRGEAITHTCERGSHWGLDFAGVSAIALERREKGRRGVGVLL